VVRASRLISLLLLLQSRGRMTAAELAAELDVSDRTVYRDVLALTEAGVPVYAEYGRDGGYRLVDGFRTRLTGLTRPEAEALFLSGTAAARTAADQLGLADTLAAAQLKVLAALPAELRDTSEHVSLRFHLDAPGWFRPAEPPPHLSTVAGAVWTDHRITATYRRRPDAGGDTVDRTLDPYGLVLKNGVWYLAARAGTSFRVYRVDRFTTVTATADTFDRDPDFDLPSFWSERAAEFERTLLRDTATVRLSPAGARLLRYAVDRTAAEEALATAGPPDEKGWITATLRIESPEIVAADLLRLGPNVEVLEPPTARDAIAGTAAAVLEIYRRTDPAGC
jgi:predicted DNA-binding transcriptional regulator YafY